MKGYALDPPKRHPLTVCRTGRSTGWVAPRSQQRGILGLYRTAGPRATENGWWTELFRFRVCRHGRLSSSGRPGKFSHPPYTFRLPPGGSTALCRTAECRGTKSIAVTGGTYVSSVYDGTPRLSYWRGSK